MRERILLFSILLALLAFLYVFQNYVNTIFGLIILLCFMTLYGVYTSLALTHKKRKLKKQPIVINENYKPFVSIMIPAHNEESVIAHTVENIRNLREDHDKKQAELADYLNVKQTTYSKYELGKINIPIEVFIKLADFYAKSTQNYQFTVQN